jgi:hypothetical protein
MLERRASPFLRDGDLQSLDAPLPLIAFVRGGSLLCVFNLGAMEMRWTAPQAQALDLGTGEAAWDGALLVLGPLSAWFGRL